MRFDDRLSTLLSQPVAGADGQVALWSQLIDLMAQDRDGIQSRSHEAALERLAELAPMVGVERRRATALAIAARAVDPAIIELFARDTPRVAAPMLGGAQLDAAGWKALIPRLPPHARALLRERRDLPLGVQDALRSYGPSDFALPPGEEPGVEDASTGSSQIRELMARIESWQQHRAAPAEVVPEQRETRAGFRFETDAEGRIVWVDGDNRAATIGLMLSDRAEPGRFGVDGQVSGAFAKRSAFRDGRMTLPETGAWLISGDPAFRADDGRFLGYHGIARAPRADEIAGGSGMASAIFPPDLARQLAHELRTPLNAIHGFAAMIDGQMLGPAASAYRDRARAILGDARRLATLIDEIDMAARIGSGEEAGQCDLPAVIAQVAGDLAALERERDASIHFRIAADLPPLAMPAPQAARLIGRLCALLIGLAGPGERLDADIRVRDGQVLLDLAKPNLILGASEAALMAGTVTPPPDNPDAPALGLPFTLRLLRAQAEAAAGSFSIAEGSFALRLLPARDSAVEAIESI